LQPFQPLSLAHAVKEVQVIKPETLKVGAVSVVESNFLMGQIQAGDQVIVELASVIGI
jgi:hypothetical protein